MGDTNAWGMKNRRMAKSQRGRERDRLYCGAEEIRNDNEEEGGKNEVQVPSSLRRTAPRV